MYTRKQNFKLYLFHTEWFLRIATALCSLPSSLWKDYMLDLSFCSLSFLILLWLSWILTALSHLSTLAHKCVILLSCTVCSVISNNSWLIFPLLFLLLCLICFLPLWIHLPLLSQSWCCHYILVWSPFILLCSSPSWFFSGPGSHCGSFW